MTLGKSQIDRLGERLKAGPRTQQDLESLDEFRRSFAPAYDSVVFTLASELGVQPSGRAAKTTDSIVAKLVRSNSKLSRIQDIAGCRLLVGDVAEQERIVTRATLLFPKNRVIDRRVVPSHGYRAVHVIVAVDDRVVEIQVRTLLQHDWAQFSEKLADAFGPEIKYGGGGLEVRQQLSILSEAVANLESLESRSLDERQRMFLERSRKEFRALLSRAASEMDRRKPR